MDHHDDFMLPTQTQTFKLHRLSANSQSAAGSGSESFLDSDKITAIECHQPQQSITVELLEAIRLVLPLHDILRAQLVNRHLKATVDDSTTLKQALFMVSEPQTKPLHIRFNPFLRHLPLFNYCEVEVCCRGPGLAERIPWFTRSTTNLTELSESFDVTTEDFHFVISCGKDDSPAEQRAEWPRGSWSDMYVTQPACEVLVYRHPDGEKMCHLEPGVSTLVDLADELGPRKLLGKGCCIQSYTGRMVEELAQICGRPNSCLQQLQLFGRGKSMTWLDVVVGVIIPHDLLISRKIS